MARTNANRITARINGTRTYFAATNPHTTTSVELNMLDDGRCAVLVESWRNTTPERCFYTHRTIRPNRAGGLDWVRSMLPLPIAA